MANITNLKLELLEHDHGTETARLKVSYTAILTSLERGVEGLRFKESIILFGEDPVQDNDLYSFSTRYFFGDSDGRVSRTRMITLSEEVLDHDIGVDEIYAKVCVDPMFPRKTCKKSNVIQHRF